MPPGYGGLGQRVRGLDSRAGVEGLGRPVNHVGRKGQRLGHVPQRRAGAVGDHVADHAHVLLAVALVDVLDHLLAAVGGKVDVDVGHGVRALAQEALKEQVVAQRVHRA